MDWHSSLITLPCNFKYQQVMKTKAPFLFIVLSFYCFFPCSFKNYDNTQDTNVLNENQLVWFRDEIKNSVAAMQKLYSKKAFMR
jgi:hypothetical protein